MNSERLEHIKNLYLSKRPGLRGRPNLDIAYLLEQLAIRDKALELSAEAANELYSDCVGYKYKKYSVSYWLARAKEELEK
jgi:hypothetical protein